ncbi:MAG: Rieske (2Fe-2S) protein [Actinobacteria bacterium]|nr:Rieske (2Fe-2S) protein [Actinomycetota bacterium]NDA38778.1 Rieske (2Fe-2S) protein [Actinomycetota bacterium]NDE12335.1 Rieske (2Fe-2S) protein [Actinomycetota bacterium]NDE83436.1 Rieske (2Fe-2S) protein [Actinomycetota bacterium]
MSSSPQAPVKVLFAKSPDVPRDNTVVINGKDQYGRPLSVAFTRTQTSLIALDASCTHAGCIVRPQGKELACPCHFSIFDSETGKPGNPFQQGAYPLSRLEVLEESGSIYLLLN